MRFGIDEQHVHCTACGESEVVPTRTDVAPLRRADRRAVATPVGSAGSDGRMATVADTNPLQQVACPVCGGEEVFVGTLTSTSCPFCAAELQRSDVHDAPTGLRVDGIIPFALSEAEAKGAIERWVGRRHLAPDSFSANAIIESMQSVYLGAYLFDVTTMTRYTGRRGDVHVAANGERSIKWSAANGTRRDTFSNAVVIANERVPPHHGARLAPWPFAEVRDFDRAYLAGHLSHTVDRSPEACLDDAIDVLDDQLEHSIEMVIGGDEQRVVQRSTIVEAASERHLLVPVWISTVAHRGDRHLVLVNGATGAVSGDAPRSMLKIGLYATLAVLVVACIVAAIAMIGPADGAFS